MVGQRRGPNFLSRGKKIKEVTKFHLFKIGTTKIIERSTTPKWDDRDVVGLEAKVVKEIRLRSSSWRLS